MKYSIITPCSYRDINRIQELKQNLESQNFNNFEWIIACNDPNLDLGKILINYKIVHFHPNSVAAARNAGIKASSGQFIIFIDADDFLIPGALRRLDRIIQFCKFPRAFIYDLNVYLTYEPEHEFLSSIQGGRNLNDKLPDQGVTKKNRRPLNRYLNLNMSNNYFGEFSEWLDNRFWVLKNEYKYYNLSLELSVNGKVIPKSIIDSLKSLFDINNFYYSNIGFMLLALEYAKGVICLSDFNYIKVMHNDPLADPSVSQISVENRWQLWISTCFRCILRINDETLIDKFMYYVINQINTYFYDDLIRSKPNVSINIKSTLIELQKILQLINFNVIKILSARNHHKINVMEQKILLHIKNGDFHQAIDVMKLLVDLRDTHKIIKQHGRGSTRKFYNLAVKFPLRKHVIFYESFLGRGFSDNPKYIYLFIQKHYPHKFLNVWSVDAEHYADVKRQLKSQPNTLVVRRWGFKYMLYLATAKYFVDNMRQPKWFIKRHGMRFLQTWHGTPLKKLVFDINYFGNEYSLLYKEIFYHQSRQWDYLISDNQYSCDAFHSSFKYPESRMLHSGYPRNDILTNPNRDKLARRIKSKLGIPLNKKVILYAPTWRDNQAIYSGHYKFTLTLNIPLLKKYLESNYVLILRTHYFITNHLDTSSFGKFVYNESDYNDISELYLISDILITDYSSVFFDYAILHRPILYYVYDYDSYVKGLHGFYLNMKKDLPGPLIKTSSGILKAIQNIDDVKRRFSTRYKKFNQRFNAWDDGNASQRAVYALLNK